MSLSSSSSNDDSSILPISAPFQQESEVISDKTDKDGHHYLKVLLLSNKKTRNNWIAPYKRIGDLPKQFIDDLIGLPSIDEHNHEYFTNLYLKLEKEGKSDEEILQALKEESRLKQNAYIDHVFMDDPNSSLLYGQLKITDPKENEYIEKYGRPSKNYTSPGIYGPYEFNDADKTMVYNIDKMRAFHIAGVKIPAFPEQEAEVKGVCKNGNSDSCKKALAFAGFDYNVLPSSTVDQQQTPTENVNNSCGCNNNIQEMSTNNLPPQNQVNTNPAPVSTVDQHQQQPTQNLLPDSKNSTQEAIEAARKEAQKVFDDNNKKSQNNNEDNKKEQPSQTEIELKQKIKQLEEERNEKLEMKNFFLEKMLVSSIPRESFKEEKEYAELKDSTKTLINKYGMSLEDADWLIAKVAKSVSQPVSTETDKKENKKTSTAYAGWLGNTTYNPDSITKPYSQPKPASSGNNLDDEDYPIPF